MYNTQTTHVRTKIALSFRPKKGRHRILYVPFVEALYIVRDLSLSLYHSSAHIFACSGAQHTRRSGINFLLPNPSAQHPTRHYCQSNRAANRFRTLPKTERRTIRLKEHKVRLYRLNVCFSSWNVWHHNLLLIACAHFGHYYTNHVVVIARDAYINNGPQPNCLLIHSPPWLVRPQPEKFDTRKTPAHLQSHVEHEHTTHSSLCGVGVVCCSREWGWQQQESMSHVRRRRTPMPSPRRRCRLRSN